MLSRDGEADRYPRRGPDDPGAPFFDGTMEHVVSSTPTDATRRNPGILGHTTPTRSAARTLGHPASRRSRHLGLATTRTVRRGFFASAEPRDGHRAGSPDAFARLERAIEEWVSR